MTTNDNSVNIKPAKTRAYHHGSVRDAAIKIGIELQKCKDSGTVGLREVAREVGISAPALYRHFPDKQALLKALAEEVSRDIVSKQLKARKNAAPGRPRADAMGLSYITYAILHPNLFRLLYDTRPPHYVFSQPTNEMVGAEQALYQEVCSLLPDSATDHERRLLAIRILSLSNGLAMAILNGVVENDPKLIAEVLRGFIV